MFVDRLARTYNIRCDNAGGRSLWGRGLVAGREVLLVKPMTFVNLSGEALQDFVSEFSISTGSLIVAHDDCDLPPGRIKIKPGGGSGGHNGVASIIACLGTTEFARIRLGIGRPSGEGLTDFVLAPFLPEELDAVDEMLERAVSSIEVLAMDGIAAAMNKFNTVN